MIHCNRRLNGVCPELTGLEGVTNRFPSAILVIVFIRLSDVLSTGYAYVFAFHLNCISFHFRIKGNYPYEDTRARIYLRTRIFTW